MSVNTIAFEGRLSRLKITFGVLFFSYCLYSVVFDRPDQHVYYKWMFEPWAQPIRWGLAVAMVWLTCTFLIELVHSLPSEPLINVKNGQITIRKFKKVSFSIAQIDSISQKSSKYTIKVGKKKYHIAVGLCQDREWLQERMDELALIVPTSRAFDDENG